MDMLIEQNIMVPMRDGVRLAVDVYRPAGDGRYPVLLTRLPYNKDSRLPHLPERRVFLELSLDVARTVAAGFVIVAQDNRGRFESEGEFTPVADDAADGVDTIAWAAAQPWSNGSVGMFGESYQGLTQLLAAAEQPPALRAIAPMHAPFAHSTMYAYRGGAFQPSVFLWWALTQGAAVDVQRRFERGLAGRAEVEAFADIENSARVWLERLPPADQPLLEGLAPYYYEWLADPERQAAQYEQTLSTMYSRITVPALIIGGWYDYFLSDTLAHYVQLRRSGGSAASRHPRLLVGPWTHVDFPGIFRERDYGPLASTRAIDLTGIHLRWFEDRLKHERGDEPPHKPVRLFVMGADEWREEDDWPLPDTLYRRYYLHSAGGANTAAGDGSLTLEAPAGEPADTLEYDPRDAVPTVGGAVMLMADGDVNTGPLDQRRVEARRDVLCYSTPPLDRPVEVIGPVELELYVSSSARDTDVTAKLVDVYPDGRAEILCDGILRARYRESATRAVLMEPGTVYRLRIDVGATANVFKAGHRIRLDVSSSNFPRFDRNTNTGGPIAWEGQDAMLTATNRVFHDSEHSSHLILPTIERHEHR